MAKDPSNLGNRIGPRVARVTADALADTHRRLGPHKRRLFMQMQEDFFHLTGAEVRATMGPLLEALAEHPDVADEARPLLRFLTKGHGQWQTILAHSVAGSALSVGIGKLLTNYLAPGVYAAIAADPLGLLDPSAVASAYATGHVHQGDAYRVAAMNGLAADQFDVLVELARQRLPPNIVLDLLNRGEISMADARTTLRYNGMDDQAIDHFLLTRRQFLSPAVAADAVIRGILTPAEGEAIAAKAGMTSGDFDLLTLDTGEAPALQTLLEAYRRGIIDDARLEHGIRTGRLRNEWFDVAKALRYSPVSPAEAITGAVEGHLDQAKARNLAEQAGLDPANFDWLFQTHGTPVAIGQALQLWNRGKMTRAEVEQVVRESRTKTKYVDAVLELRRHILPERTVASMFGKGTLTKAQATERLRWVGVADEDIGPLLAEHAATKTAGVRELSQSTVLALFADGAISEATCRAHLSALGYADTDVTLILSLTKLAATRKLQQAAVAVVRAKYVARHLARDRAVAALDAAKVSADERDTLLGVWDLEREATRRLPTVAELTAAQKAQAITTDEWVQRIVDLGYDEADVPVMMAAHKIST